MDPSQLPEEEQLGILLELADENLKLIEQVAGGR